MESQISIFIHLDLSTLPRRVDLNVFIRALGLVADHSDLGWGNGDWRELGKVVQNFLESLNEAVPLGLT